MLSGDDPDFVSKAQQLVRQGVTGSGQETPYEALRLAVAEPFNAPFFRDGARLLVLVVSDEDDCSDMTRPPRASVGTDPSVDDCMLADNAGQLTPVKDYFDIFNNLTDSTGARREVIWTEIAPVSSETTRRNRSRMIQGVLACAANAWGSCSL